ncbi:MAG TPA: hypothetical protein VKV21_14890 [Solirubrobacteraceae bacterium]|nr:hypothetical protein [Solirubrobacteraceae bacterium]
MLLEMTAAGRERPHAYVERGARRERQLLHELGQADRRRLNRLLQKPVAALEDERAAFAD